jgi:hypothetical protein
MRSDQPLTVFVDTVSYCNARCPFCPLFQGTDRMDRAVHPALHMDLGLFDKLMGQLAALPRSPNVIYIGLHGEPTMDRVFAERMAIVARHGLGGVTDLLTNGQFLDADKVRLLLDAGVSRITLGFDGATKATYQAHRVRCDYDRVLDNLREFTRQRAERQAKCSVAVQYVRTAANAHETRAAYRMFGEMLDPEQDYFQDNFAKDWASPPLREGNLVSLRAPPGKPKTPTCMRAETELIVHADGRIGACSWDYNLEIAGAAGMSLVDMDIMEMWEGAARAGMMAPIRAGEIEAAPERCRSCVYLHDYSDLPKTEAMIEDDSLVFANPYALIYRFPKREKATA